MLKKQLIAQELCETKTEIINKYVVKILNMNAN